MKKSNAQLEYQQNLSGIIAVDLTRKKIVIFKSILVDLDYANIV